MLTRTPVRLLEQTRFQGGRVDRAQCVIKGVKILGDTSDNSTKGSSGRRYSRAAMQAALPLYEGKSVRIDHPDKPTDRRHPDAIFGWLKNCRLMEDGPDFEDREAARVDAERRMAEAQRDWEAAATSGCV